MPLFLLYEYLRFHQIGVAQFWIEPGCFGKAQKRCIIFIQERFQTAFDQPHVCRIRRICKRQAGLNMGESRTEIAAGNRYLSEPVVIVVRCWCTQCCCRHVPCPLQPVLCDIFIFLQKVSPSCGIGFIFEIRQIGRHIDDTIHDRCQHQNNRQQECSAAQPSAALAAHC